MIGLFKFTGEILYLLKNGRRKNVANLSSTKHDRIAENDSIGVVLHAHGETEHDQVEQVGKKQSITVEIGQSTEGAKFFRPLAHNVARLAQRLHDQKRLLVELHRLLAELSILDKIKRRRIRYRVRVDAHNLRQKRRLLRATAVRLYTIRTLGLRGQTSAPALEIVRAHHFLDHAHR